jgi:hypothetical protein
VPVSQYTHWIAPPLGPDGRLAVVLVEVLQVDLEDLRRAGRGLVQRPPQGLLAQRDVAA